MSEDRIRIGIIGAGANTRLRHIPGLKGIGGVELAAVCNRSRASGERAAAEFGIPKVCEHWREIVEDETLDGVVIGTWPYLHAPATIAALEAGKHVLVEARMAMNAAEARRMLMAARSRPDLTAQVVPSPFTLGVDATVRRLLVEGHYGEPLAIRVRHGNEFLERAALLHWRQDFDLSGYNVLTMGIWYEALLRWVGEAVRVTAMGRVFQKLRHDETGAPRAVRVPEHVDIIAEMACGAQAQMQFSAVTGLAGGPEAVIHCAEGTLRFDGERLWSGRRGEKEPRQVEIPGHERGGWRVEEEFIASVRGEAPVRRTTFADGVKYMEFTEAVARSSAEGRAVALPL